MTLRHQAHSLLESEKPPSPGAHLQAPWISITGGKGGVGKSLIATNLAISIANAGYRALLVDLDPGLANLDVHLRLAPRFTLEDLADGSCTAEQAICKSPGRIAVLCGKSGSTRLTDDPEFVHRALERVAAASTGFDVVVCDTGAGIGRSVLGATQRSDLTIAVTTPDPAAVTDTYALCKLLVTRGIPTPRLLVNLVRSREEAMRTASRLSSVCEKFLSTKLDLVGWLRRDSELETSVRDQRPYTVAGNGPAMEDIRAIAAKTLSSIPAAHRRRDGLKRRSLRQLRQPR